MFDGQSKDIFQAAAAVELMILSLDIFDDLQDQDNFSVPWHNINPALAMNIATGLLVLSTKAIEQTSLEQDRKVMAGGINYPIIGQEPYDADILDNWSDIYTSADGYRWNRVYYPVSSDGQYNSSRVGWAVTTVVSTGEKWTETCSNVKVNQSMYFYLSYNLTSPTELHTSGEYVSKASTDLYLSYQPNYLNS
ncbi:hypothetical protein [Desulfosporosinus shakirovi]|uniref:hypothetical protein n=1 Tax=Desulfosporosinus shakirovi TaxID=2885154 RepID=UPI001E53179F|nr:hypothetical protein [Desulfosporosinus sp. SRJS8]MCB8818201.1 hypothetical protein [Desulfosporosinus sp. SRJS8]